MPVSPFAAALRAAMRASGLTLHGVRTRLLRRGISVSVATLSTWQTGTHQPERARSLRAVAALEEVLDLRERTLTGALGPPRPRGRRAGTRYDGLPHADAVSDIVERICPSDRAPARVLCAQEEVVLTGAGLLGHVGTRVVAEARADGVDRCFAVSYAGPGYDLDRITAFATRHCRVGRVRRDYDCGLVGAEFLLDRHHRAGDAFVVEYGFDVGQRFGECEYFRAFSDPIGLYTVEVRFDGDRLPVRCYRFDADRPGEGRTERELVLSGSGTAVVAAENAESSVCGIRWEWE
ncbi:hypothetical protein [Actinokineospora cianjurensis]|uniref:hypothetical protein n=1 Tax=Actinokineospora cianjurensis TaxID=585224 RepID=UPI0011C493D2|nr:hypothetical protein [Actinokineospora cianjurensis]